MSADTNTYTAALIATLEARLVILTEKLGRAKDDARRSNVQSKIDGCVEQIAAIKAKAASQK